MFNIRMSISRNTLYSVLELESLRERLIADYDTPPSEGVLAMLTIIVTPYAIMASSTRNVPRPRELIEVKSNKRDTNVLKNKRKGNLA